MNEECSESNEFGLINALMLTATNHKVVIFCESVVQYRIFNKYPTNSFAISGVGYNFNFFLKRSLNFIGIRYRLRKMW